ncbi:MAG: hypothetical protein Q7V05_09525 [Methanoregula sp.]|nr:hypothetical protein [Methanoregula sp.]
MVNVNELKIPGKGKPMMDVIFAIVLLIATLSTAFCVYQATRWSGVQSIDYGESSMLRSESLRATNIVTSQVIIDVQLYTSWLNAVAGGDKAEAAFLRERFRKEFRPAFDAWLESADADYQGGIPEGTPFDRPEYNLHYYTESNLLEDNATAAFNHGKDANTNGDMYISNTILFAIVLFFCGIYSRWESVKIRIGLLGMTLLIFSYAMYTMGTLLLQVGYL